VSEAQLGDEVGLLIPFAVDKTSTKGLLHSGVDYVPPATSARRVLVADETALPALAGILEELPAGVQAVAFVAVPDVADVRPLASDAQVTWVTEGSLLDALKAVELPFDPDYAWVAGESSMIKEVRRHLVNAVGMPKSAISFQGYWKRGEAHC
jgi:NADPH-dependent ferric siderophore reductase